MRTLLCFVCSITLSLPVWAIEPARLYGSHSHYQVERKGKVIGNYDLSFSPWGQGGTHVSVAMDLSIRFMGLFRYDFEYRSDEYWRDGHTLEQMQVRIDDDGDLTQYTFERRDGYLYRTEPGGGKRLGTDLLTTNHWHPELVRRSSLINTLTGDVSQINAQLESEEWVELGNRRVQARRYRLGGDLDDTLSWYDTEGRWLGMEFSARDGSRVRVWLQPDQMTASLGEQYE